MYSVLDDMQADQQLPKKQLSREEARKEAEDLVRKAKAKREVALLGPIYIMHAYRQSCAHTHSGCRIGHSPFSYTEDLQQIL